MNSFGPSARNDPAYILLLANALVELRSRLVATITRITANYLANTPNEVILADATSAALSVSLPDVKDFYGMSLIVKKMDVSGNAVTITPQATQTIDGGSSKTITSQYVSYTVLSTGTEWVIV